MNNKWTLQEVRKFCEERGTTLSRNTPYNWSETLRGTDLVEKRASDRGGDELMFSPMFALLMLARTRQPNKYLPGKPEPEKIGPLLCELSLGHEIEDEWLGLQYVTEEDVEAAWATECPHSGGCIHADCEIHGDHWMFCRPVNVKKENEGNDDN